MHQFYYIQVGFKGIYTARTCFPDVYVCNLNFYRFENTPTKSLSSLYNLRASITFLDFCLLPAITYSIRDFVRVKITISMLDIVSALSLQGQVSVNLGL